MVVFFVSFDILISTLHFFPCVRVLSIKRRGTVKTIIVHLSASDIEAQRQFKKLFIVLVVKTGKQQNCNIINYSEDQTIYAAIKPEISIKTIH